MNQSTLNSVVEFFISNGCRHMTRIPGNQVFLTDVSASTLVWHEGPVVIELYLMYPNRVTGLHHHPFDNQVIYLHGQMWGHRANLEGEGIIEGALFEKLGGPPMAGSVVPAGSLHGFRAGPRGAVVYNVQIWPESVSDPLSAALNFLGPTLGPIHDQTLLNHFSGVDRPPQ